MEFLCILHAGKALYGGDVVIGVSYVGVPVHSETIDLCKEVSCPVANGNFVISHSQTLPAITPPGPYALKMTLKDDKGGQLTCIKFNFKIVFGALVSDMWSVILCMLDLEGYFFALLSSVFFTVKCIVYHLSRVIVTRANVVKCLSYIHYTVTWTHNVL